jgi:ssDNA-binding replication factor A large subunit
MNGDNYKKILEKIAKVAGLEASEIERRVEAKRAKLSGLISPEGAAQVIAAELGINFDDEKLKLNEILPGMRKVNVTGKIISLFPVREFTTKKGDAGKVCNFILADDTSNIKVVLWDVNHIGLIEKGSIAEGACIEIANGTVRDNEIHLGSFSEFKPSTETFENVITEKSVNEKSLVDVKTNDSIKTRSFIVQSFEPRFFNVCPQCKKKVLASEDGANFSCGEHGQVPPEKRALINIVLDDGTETIRAVAFHDILNSLGLKDLENSEMLVQQRENLLGKEMIFSGNIRMNKFFNNPEFIIDTIEEVDLDNLIVTLEK